MVSEYIHCTCETTYTAVKFSNFDLTVSLQGHNIRAINSKEPIVATTSMLDPNRVKCLVATCSNDISTTTLTTRSSAITEGPREAPCQ